MNFNICFSPLWSYLRENFYGMDRKSKNIYWLLFFVSLIVSVLVYLYLPSITSITIVPVVTTFVKALDLI